MDRKALVMLGMVGVLVFSTPAAWARTCPKLIREGRETLAKAGLAKGEEEKIKGLLDEAQKLHDDGSHSASVRKAKEALELLKKK